MALDSGQLIVEVINGSSTTWGSFGSPGDLRIDRYEFLGSERLHADVLS